MSKLYIVGTPIGNLKDITFRAIETLNAVDFIAAEDTRVTIKLLNAYNIKKPMISYYEHNEKSKTYDIIGRIINGENCALVSDAGMPCICDPGSELILQAIEKNIAIEVIPGPTAFSTGLILSGLSTASFTFEGFLSANRKSRIEHLTSVKNEPRSMIFYEAPHKLLRTLQDMLDILGDRKCAATRELTKIYEEVIRGNISDALKRFKEIPPKGEFVLVIEGYTKEENTMTFEQAISMARSLIKDGTKATDAAKQVALISQFKKSELYKELS